ncbi:hypothetical protein [Streptomyces sp. NPDC059378]|uniref:hypothetical protein n=1 Tax=Streptomyces sp. NPDC059378 TaxID=3346815 RepID=UPI00368C15BA
MSWKDEIMRITVLTVPDCPNAPVIAERLARVLEGRGAVVALVEVRDAGQAERFGMTGSPTVLIDGVDPFAVPGAPSSLSCRLYRGPDGRAEGAPGVADLQRALDAADACTIVEPVRVEDQGRSVYGDALYRAEPSAGRGR